MLQAGDPAPTFSAPDQAGKTHTLADYAGRRFVLFFYPRDHTLICTREVCAFQDELESFRGVDVPVLGVSRNGIGSHKAFAENHRLEFPLLSDRDGAMIRDFDAEGLLGRIKRVTYIIGPDGHIEGVHRHELSGRAHAEWARRTVQETHAATGAPAR